MDKTLRPKIVPFIVTLLAIPFFLLVIATAYFGSRFLRQTMPLQDASMMIKNELVRFHLEVERYVYIDNSGSPREVFRHLDHAERYANAMLYGGRDREWKYIPLEDPELRGEISIMISRIKDLRAVTEKRLALRMSDKASMEMERKFDPLVIAVTEQAERLEGALHDTILKQQRNYLSLVYAFLASCVLLAAVLVTVLFRNLSTVKKNEEEIASARSFLGSIIDGVTELIMVIDTNYNITLVNKASDDFFEGRKIKCYEYSHGLEKPCETCWPCPMVQVLETGQPVTLDHEHYDKSGNRTIVEISASPLKDAEGRVIGIIETSRDVTERKELERQRADFFAMVTHDLKSPLTSIMGYSELMLSGQAGNFDESIREMLESVNKSGGKLFRTVDDFLALSKMESGQKLLPAPGRISEALREVASEFAITARQKEVEFTSELPDDLPIAMFDRRGVQRAVSNLLQNAVNYTPSGGKISLKAGLRATDEGNFLEIVVSDTGPGIPREDRAKIFEKYYRAQKTSGVRGSGLGLAIVKAVAEAHGGRVELESEEGKGSTFRLLLSAGAAKAA